MKRSRNLKLSKMTHLGRISDSSGVFVMVLDDAVPDRMDIGSFARALLSSLYLLFIFSVVLRESV